MYFLPLPQGQGSSHRMPARGLRHRPLWKPLHHRPRGKIEERRTHRTSLLLEGECFEPRHEPRELVVLEKLRRRHDQKLSAQRQVLATEETCLADERLARAALPFLLIPPGAEQQGDPLSLPGQAALLHSLDQGSRHVSLAVAGEPGDDVRIWQQMSAVLEVPRVNGKLTLQGREREMGEGTVQRLIDRSREKLVQLLGTLGQA